MQATTPTTPTTTSSQSKPRIRYHGLNHYSVGSRTREGHVHHIDTYHLTCSCEAGQRGKRCWALAVALEFERWRKQQEIKARASAPVPPVPAPLPATPAVAGDWHTSAAYLGMAEAFGE